MDEKFRLVYDPTDWDRGLFTGRICEECGATAPYSAYTSFSHAGDCNRTPSCRVGKRFIQSVIMLALAQRGECPDTDHFVTKGVTVEDLKRVLPEALRAGEIRCASIIRDYGGMVKAGTTRWRSEELQRFYEEEICGAVSSIPVQRKSPGREEYLADVGKFNRRRA